MELLLLLIYSFFAWLVFFKFKWLPWNITTQVITITIPVIAIAMLILFLNIVAPSSSDVRVINYVVQIVPRVAGRIIEVPVEPDRPVKKGAVLFRIDPILYQADVDALDAQRESLVAELGSTQAYARELDEQLRSARGKRVATVARLELARKRLAQTRELAQAGAGSQYDFEQAETDVGNLEGEVAAAQASEAQIAQKLSARSADNELQDVAKIRASIAQVDAQLDAARWKLAETTVLAPSNGTVVNLQLREGSAVTAFPVAPAMSFVEDEQWVLALFRQNELRNIKPGQEAEIALKTHPNRIIKCKVDSIIWASGTGQLPISGVIPNQLTQPMPPGYFAVRLLPEGKDRELFLAAGAAGIGAVYTDHGAMVHIVRKVFLRISSKLDWLVLKVH
jgi:multidrug resistance efflux pump